MNRMICLGDLHHLALRIENLQWRRMLARTPTEQLRLREDVRGVWAEMERYKIIVEEEVVKVEAGFARDRSRLWIE